MRARAIIMPLLTATLPSVAFGAPRTFAELANFITYLLDNATAVLIVLGIVVYFYGVSTNILKFGEESREKVRAYFFWGIIVLFLMVSVWGVLRLLQNTLFGGEQIVDAQGDSFQSGGDSYTSQNLFNPPGFQE